MKTVHHFILSSCMRQRYLLALAAALLVFIQQPAAQISEGGVPYTFLTRGLGPAARYSMNVTLKNPPPVITTDTTEGDTAIIYDEVIGEVFPVGISPLSHGTWNTLPNGDQLWRINITSNTGAYMMLVFNDFYLPKGTSLYVYSEDQSQVLGAFTSRNNTPQNKFTTAPLKCNSLVLEYYRPHGVSEQEKLSVRSVGLVTQDFGGVITKELGSSGDCMINAKCSQYENWCNQRRSVALIIRVNEEQEQIRWCSGALVTNERQDGKPFLLTAFHCLDITSNKELDQSELDAVQNWMFIFNYQSETCDNPSAEPSMLYSISGAEYASGHRKTDYALIRLSQKPPKNYNVFYSGWNNDKDDITNTGACIHHPAGDIKKFSEWDKRATTKTNFWKVKWTAGSTQGGSSGSPMFNSNGLIVGQNNSTNNLAAVCKDSKRDFFGRFDKSWHKFGLNSELNPNGDLDQVYISSMSGDETCREYWNFPSGNDLHTSSNVTFMNGSIGTRQYDGIYNATDWIKAEVVTIQAATAVTFEAGRKINLMPGFHAQAGSIFTAAIANCERGCGNGYKKKADENRMVISHRKPAPDEPVMQKTGNDIGQAINVYPNTSPGLFTVELRNSFQQPISEIKVYDLQGRLIKTVPVNNTKTTIDITGQPAGMYLLQIISGNETGLRRVIVTGNK
jgi:V8-like Glu-specific endopeptidase